MALVARRAELLQSLVQEIEAAGGRAIALPCDVTQRQQLQQAVAQAEAQLGPITRLVANAGGGQPTFVESFNADEVEATINLNLIGVVNSVNAVLPGMLARGTGQLIATGSLAGVRGLPTAGAYSAAKAGVANFMESLRIDLRPKGITVTLLLPGFVQTKPTKKRKFLQLKLEDATQRMAQAIIANKPRLAFPWTLALAFALIRMLPAPLYDRILRGWGRKSKHANGKSDAAVK